MLVIELRAGNLPIKAKLIEQGSYVSHSTDRRLGRLQGAISRS